MKLSDFKDEEALDVMADLIAPATRIFSNRQLLTAVKNGKNKLELARLAIKADKKAVLEMLAILSGTAKEEFHCTIPSILMQLSELMNDKELLDFLSSVEQMGDASASTSASENTMENIQ